MVDFNHSSSSSSVFRPNFTMKCNRSNDSNARYTVNQLILLLKVVSVVDLEFEQADDFIENRDFASICIVMVAD